MSARVPSVNVSVCVCVLVAFRKSSIESMGQQYYVRRAESLVVSILSKFIVYATGSCLHLLYMLHWLWIVCGAQSFEVTSK